MTKLSIQSLVLGNAMIQEDMEAIVRPLTDSLTVLGMAISGNEAFLINNSIVAYAVTLYLVGAAGVGVVMVFGEDMQNSFITNLLPYSGKIFHFLVVFAVCVMVLTGLHHYYLYQSNLPGG